ncbi:VanZ family protein [Lapillicoccus jejuensis]|uniref:VanZ like protein n=1 Tax=Lapillicoccus jejuensis TaxID=402171 RepID=A0A542DVP8_9MICO|nr:VanZ family protein [Lapillicoccus jejuensis]TQJ07179.1 hypothetical protein FB458_0232 [Lapillicoccus jejuensis]
MSSTRRSPLLGVLALVAVALQLAALYWPRVTIEGPTTWTDKLVHPAIFALPLVLVSLWWGRWRPVLLVLLVHAPVSELVQHYVLPHRDGDVLDALTDVAGLVVGLLVLALVARVRRSRGRTRAAALVD